MLSTSRVAVLAGLAVSLGSQAYAAKEPSKAKAKAKEAAAAEPAPDDAPADGKPKYTFVSGPTTVQLGNDLSINLREADLFLDKENASRFLLAEGNQPGDDLLGIVLQAESTWMVEISFADEGYVKDDEAEQLDADEILGVIREGTEAANKYREEHGFEALKVDGWSESPHYDKKSHHVVWGIKGSTKDHQVVNFNTRVLGRRGYASLNLIDDAKTIDASKPEVTALLSATTFAQGARYEDFDAKNDKVAEYGLAALVAGGAGAAALKLAKVGLLAKFGAKLVALIIAGKKFFVVGLIAVFAIVKKLLGLRRKITDVQPRPPENPPGAAPPPTV